VLLIFAIAIVGIIAPVEAKLYVHSGVYEQSKGKTTVYLNVNSDGESVSKNNAELNKVNRAVVSIKGHNTVTIKKPVKGWNTGKHGSIFKTFSVKGNPLGKSYSVKLYNNKGKLIKQVNGKALPGN